MLSASKPQNYACQALRWRGGDLRARFAARSTRVLVLGAQADPQGSLRLAYTPPPAGAGPHITLKIAPSPTEQRGKGKGRRGPACSPDR